MTRVWCLSLAMAFSLLTTAGFSQNSLVIKVVMGVFKNQTLASIMSFHTFSLSDNGNMKILQKIC